MEKALCRNVAARASRIVAVASKAKDNSNGHNNGKLHRDGSMVAREGHLS